MRRAVRSAYLIEKHLGDKLSEEIFSEEDRRDKWEAIESVKLPLDTFVDSKADVDIYID